jgi:hypothetical protein
LSLKEIAYNPNPAIPSCMAIALDRHDKYILYPEYSPSFLSNFMKRVMKN